MRRIWILILVLIGLIIIAFVFWDPTDDRQDLKQLENAMLDSAKVYCRYKLTKVNCSQTTQFKVGDIICIECCTSRTPPWPNLVAVNNNCPKEIKFTMSLNNCALEADRLEQTCAKCNAAETKSVLACPNP